MKQEKKRKLKIWPIITVLLIICMILFCICIKDIYMSLKSTGKQVKVLETIENYDYNLNENDPKYVKDLFKQLKKTLSSQDINEENYVSLVSQIFLADFYTLNSAINGNDVGGTQFVYTNHQEDFVKKAKSSVYRYIENNIYGNRKQELPTVMNVEIKNIESTEYESDVATDSDAYKVECTITYDKELDYPETVTLVLIHQDQKLVIAKMSE